jgi:hypothetical protein
MAEVESLRRAIRTLTAAGLVESQHFYIYDFFTGGRSMLKARVPLTAEEKEQEDKEIAEATLRMKPIYDWAERLEKRAKLAKSRR